MGFDGMTVTLQDSNPEYYTESITIPAPETRVQRFVRLFTRKSAPTEVKDVTRTREHFHTVEVDDTHDAETVRTLLDKLTDRYAFEIVSALVDVDGTTYEMVDGMNTSPTGDALGTFLVALVDDPYRASGVVNAAKEYGIENDMTSEWFDDHYHGEWDSAEEYTENLVEDCYTTDIPDFVEIDWTETADNLRYDYDFVTDPETYKTHVFSRN